MYATISVRRTRPLASLLGVPRLSNDDARRWREIMAAKEADGDPDAIPALLDAMDAPVRGTRLWLIERWTAAHARGETIASSPALQQLRASFPDDPGLQALFVQLAWAQGDVASELAHLAAFRRAIAVDPLLDLRACGLAAQVESWPEALVSCGHAVASLPDESQGWSGLIEASGNAVATPTFIDAVVGFEERFERRVDVRALVERAGWAELAADPLYQAWRDEREAIDRKAADAAADEGEAERPRRRRR